MISRITGRERGGFFERRRRARGWGVFEPAKGSDRLTKPLFPNVLQFCQLSAFVCVTVCDPVRLLCDDECNDAF
jgi:hypothetical protein